MNEIERLKATLRRIVVTCGGYAQPGVSTDFLESTADEVEAMVGNYNARIAALAAERDALKAELTRVRDLAEGDRAAFSNTLCTYRTALRETRAALIEMLNNGGCSTVEWMPLATIKTARSILARHAGLVEEVDRG